MKQWTRVPLKSRIWKTRVLRISYPLFPNILLYWAGGGERRLNPSTCIFIIPAASKYLKTDLDLVYVKFTRVSSSWNRVMPLLPVQLASKRTSSLEREEEKKMSP